ncbi:MAG: hypothetical protein IFK94_01735 [Acidobacteria bacterium]|uniref:Uncharacterized protein n=1 Tax=Candidatus Polarisedimenticola svalbardensis TaxID=2886004 RepID=A0A8J6XYP5_9BACT|nr:hypothetical protein [Candidatus Polarisedimenticola svalbardensis]
MENKVVVHLKNGKIHKGVTQDFDPSREEFYLLPAEGGGIPMKIVLEGMKAMFYVRDYIGNRHFNASRGHAGALENARKVILRFNDGEELWGTKEDISDEGPGFFFYPTDREDNNIRIFVIRSSLSGMEIVD